jgi:Tol biopolymer transport system component/predicted Ser/Thr protein kinase
MSFEPGTRIGPYEIVALLGAGGMGQVYRARDLRLKREVALKVLPADVAGDRERLARFQREAEVLATLNHPNIAQVYGIDANALVMELVQGEDLAQRLARGPIPLDEALPIAKQIAEALESAHDAGIVHRDLKPANVKLREDGTVKVLDFGLAKAFDAGLATSSAVQVSSAPTMASPNVTMSGVILGTPAYMAPEQARGKPVDKRADIWAFGVLLYEIISGLRPFNGDTLSDTIASVLTGDVDFSAIPAATPHSIRTLIERCLQRDPKARLRDIGEARIVLSAPGEATRTAASGQATRGSWRPGRAWLFGAVLAAIAIVIAAARPLWLRAPSSTDRPLLTLGIDAGGDTTIAGVGFVGLNWIGPAAVLSPDGTSLVFIARGPSGGRWQLFVRRLDQLDASPIAGTEGAYAPFFSPDGTSVAFFASGRLVKVALNGGTVTPICPVEEARGGAWSEDGTIVFAPRPDGPLYRVSASGGELSQVTTLDAGAGEITHRWPQFLPGGTTFLFTAHGNTGAAHEGRVIIQNASGRTLVQQGAIFGRYAPSGHLLYVNGGKLFAAAFDPDRLQVTGRVVPMADDIATALISGTAQYAFSDTGVLAYRRARNPRRVLQWMDSSGQMQPLRSVSAEYQEARFSRDGTRLLLTIGDGVQSDIWSYDIASDTPKRLTFYADNDRSGIWSPDGTHFVYSSWQPDVGTFNLFLQSATGGGESQRLTTSKNVQSPTDWHPNGKDIVFTEARRDSGMDLILMPIDIAENGVAKVGDATELMVTPANEDSARFAPDGKWIAYTSDEGGRNDVYVQPFPGGGGRWQVSADGAEWIEWRKGGLFYGLSEEVVMRVPYRVDGRTFAAGKPELWMRIPQGVLWVDPPTSGTRAATIRADDKRSESLVLVVNFFDELRRRAPVGR